MNDKIKELSAGLNLPPERCQELAQRIILECLTVVDQFEEPTTGPEIGDSIIEHFGLR